MYENVYPPALLDWTMGSTSRRQAEVSYACPLGSRYLSYLTRDGDETHDMLQAQQKLNCAIGNSYRVG
jgi:hypothetical protein